MKRTPIRRISKKRLQEIKDEVQARILLAKRCGGEFIFRSTITGGYCKGGRCEECSKQMPLMPKTDFDILKPHEDPPRSRGGRVSLKDSKMVCDTCGKKAHGLKVVDSSPMWTKEVTDV